MEREYIRGNSKYWKNICKYIYEYVPEDQINYSYCGDDKIIFVKNQIGKFTVYSDPILYEAITTNPNWHEIKPWEKYYEPKPFDKVLGWNYDEDKACPDIFFNYNSFGEYNCANCLYKHVKPYNEKEYLKSLKNKL